MARTLPDKELKLQKLRADALVRDLDESLKDANRLRQEAEAAKKKAEELAQFPINDPSPIIKCDIEKEAILFLNPAAFNNYPDLLKKGFDHPLLKDIHAFGDQAFTAKKAITREVQVGPIIYQQAVMPNFLGEERTVTIYNYNISKLKETEATLREETLRAEAANRAKGDFLANMSHELRTPMNGVLGMAGLLKDTNLSPEQRELVETIFHSGESLLMLLNDLLDLSKIEAGQLTLEDIPFNLNNTIHETVRLLEPLAKTKGLALHYYYNHAAPECVVGDPARIRQVVTNLLGNALKFTEKGAVKLDVTSCRLSDGRPEISFRIDDTGIGIDEKHLDKIFEKFTQADESTTRRFGGTGLGLTICKLLVEAMGGRIGVESVVGKGSSFWFSIPFTAATKEQSARLNQENATAEGALCPLVDFSNQRILVIDDHPVNLFFAKKLLLKFGFKTVDTADDGRTALQMMERGRYDLVMTDCQMPDMDGYEVSRMIRAWESGTDKRVPIVAMTANAMVGDREKCLAAGMDDYVSKPINGNKLLEILIKWLREAGAPARPSLLTQSIETAKTQAPSQSPVSMEHIKEYIGDDPEERKMVFDMFTKGAEESLAILAANSGDGDNQAWKKAAHKLKGSAANLGAAPLAALCREAETFFMANAAEKELLLSRIQRAYKDVVDFLA